MNPIQKRFALFLFGCIGIRILFVIIAKKIALRYLPILGYLALLIAIGFLYIFVTGSRKTGFEIGGDKIWWDWLRPVHSLIYFLFAYNAIAFIFIISLNPEKFLHFFLRWYIPFNLLMFQLPIFSCQTYDDYN